MKKGWSVVFVLLIVIIVGLLVLILVPGAHVAKSPTTSDTTGTTAPDNSSALSDTIVVSSPAVNGTVSTPLTVSGQARGSWYFEASAPIALLDSSGSVIAQGHIQAQGNWMTSDFVPFSGTLTFPPQPAGSVGTLVLTNDNPSGDPANQKTLDIPVKF